MILNAIKIFALCYFHQQFLMFFFMNSDDISEMEFSPFSHEFTIFHVFQPYIHVALTVVLQIFSCWKNTELINDILKFRCKFILTFPSCKKLFENCETLCLRNVAIVWIVCLSFISLDIIIIMQHTLLGILAYIGFSLPFFINLSFLCYFYIIVQFVICSQKALYSCSTELNKESVEVAQTLTINSIAKLHAQLFEIKEKIASTLGLQITFLMFYYLCEIVFEVIN